MAVRHATDRLRHGGREERHLTFARQRSRIWSTASMKPMRSISSASSSTTIDSASVLRLFALEVIDHPARRADDDLRPARQLLELHAQALSAVDRQDLEARHEVGAYFWKASATWMASSRVGVSTSTWGLLSLGSMRASNGSAKAAVLPVPVWAWPSMFLCLRAAAGYRRPGWGRVFVADRTEGTQQRLWQAEVGKAGRSVGIGVWFP